MCKYINCKYCFTAVVILCCFCKAKKAENLKVKINAIQHWESVKISWQGITTCFVLINQTSPIISIKVPKSETQANKK